MSQLLTSSSDEFASRDIGLANLVTAQELPGAQSLDICGCLSKLNRWADTAYRFTRDSASDFRARPERYNRSRAYFCMLCLVTLLERGLGLRYQPTAIGNQLFRDSRDDFLHGLLTRGLGTCASFPVLHVALGRRLGYPLYLAIAKRHVFSMWVESDRAERFNIEAVGNGLNTPSDNFYRHWPVEMTEHDLASNEYLRPLKPAEETALFLANRGHCLTDNGRFDEAEVAYEQANSLWPRPVAHAANLELLRLNRLMKPSERGIKSNGFKISSTLECPCIDQKG